MGPESLMALLGLSSQHVCVPLERIPSLKDHFISFLCFPQHLALGARA